MSTRQNTWPSPPAGYAGPGRGPGGALAWLGGADRETLLLARTGRNQFIQMGLVIVATAGLGALSMMFALFNALHLDMGPAILGGLIWGCVVAVLDRFLVVSLNLRGGPWRATAIIGVRVLIAAVLGFVISTPLVLQVFQPEIQAQIAVSNAAASGDFANVLDATGTAEELTRVRAEIATNEAVLAGQLPGDGTSPVQADVQNKQEYLRQAQERATAVQQDSDQKYRAWQCELYGESCEGSTGEAGNGSLAQAREQAYRETLPQLEQARQAVTDAASALEAVRQQQSTQGDDALAQAQEAAKAALGPLRERERTLQDKYNELLDAGSQANQDNTGLLAQLTALSALGANSTEAGLAHWGIGLLFFLIELLPVVVKTLTSLGPPSAYERVRELLEESKVEGAKVENRRRNRERDEQERRLLADADKQRDIDDDMRAREKDLGVKANRRVAAEMETVLEAALDRWTLDVHRTLRQAPGPTHPGPAVRRPADAGSHRSGGASAVSAPGHPASAAPGGVVPNDVPGVTQAVRSRFNMPRGDLLGNVNGTAP